MLLKASKTTLTLMLCLGFVTASGCKSVDFGKPSLPALPKLPSLAFWKKGEGSELPPPPARHFDPSRFGGGAETQVADAGSATRASEAKFDQYGIRVKDSAGDVSKLASSGLATAKANVEKFAAKPMRKPYQLDDVDAVETLAKAENKFNLDTANLKNRLSEAKALTSDAKASTSNQLSNAQQDFRSAMNSATAVQSSGKDALKSASNSFVAAPVAKPVDAAKGFGSIGGGSFSPKTGAFGNVKQATAAAAESVNGPLYDAQGRLRSAASRIGNQAENIAQSNDPNSLKTKFEQRLLAARQQGEAQSEAFKSGTLKATNNQLNALANVSDRTKDLINQPFPKIGADGGLIPQKSGQFNTAVKPPALQAGNNGLLPINKPNALAANSFGGSSDSDAVSQMRSEVDDAKRQIALLRAQIAASRQSTAAAAQPVQRVVHNTIEGVVLPLERVNDAFNPKAGAPVVNQYQGKLYSPAGLQPQAPQSPSYNSNPTDSNSFYPATPYGGFGSTQDVKGAVGQVGFNAANEFQNRVSQANAQAPVESYSSSIPRASRIDSSVSEVLIPSSILTGNSSFTPGSTTPLR